MVTVTNSTSCINGWVSASKEVEQIHTEDICVYLTVTVTWVPLTNWCCQSHQGFGSNNNSPVKVLNIWCTVTRSAAGSIWTPPPTSGWNRFKTKHNVLSFKNISFELLHTGSKTHLNINETCHWQFCVKAMAVMQKSVATVQWLLLQFLICVFMLLYLSE